jgi:two-component system sensor histidine kinase KdpD
MNQPAANPGGVPFRRAFTRLLFHVVLGLLSILVTIGMAYGAFRLHLNLAAIGSLAILLVVLVAHRWGFAHASVVSVAAVACMNYLFIPPIFEFQIADPENWISMVTFETTALLISGLSSKLRMHASLAEIQRARTAKLYELSRAILLIDGRRSTSEQLSALIEEIVKVESAELWSVYEDGASSPTREAEVAPGSAEQKFLGGADRDDPEPRVAHRVLRLGSTPIGAMVLRGFEHDALLADAVASLAAVAMERAASLQKENRAEAERNTERLRTAVLDGLAHGFKTPLTAIQTASSGLLAIDPQLTPTQAELVSIIDDEAAALNQLATRLLQTAALEATEVRMERSPISVASLLKDVLEDEEPATRDRITISAPSDLHEIDVDAQMIRLALLQLIDNAAKYSVGERQIEMTVTQDERQTTIEVANGGSSIKPEERYLIFERFYRGIETTHGPSGTGLGLSIVKKTAEAHGGRSWVECENDTTRFFLVMPRQNGGFHG